MPLLGVADETFIVAAPAEVALAVADAGNWRGWWPDLEPTVARDRGVEGIQWLLRGAVTGRMELWLEPFADGVIVHYILWVDEPGSRGPARLQRRVRDWKGHVHRLKDQLEAGREPGCPRRTRDVPVKDTGSPAE